MRLKIVQFFAGVIIYSLFGMLILLVSGKGMAGKWNFIIFWTLGMAVMHVLIIEPMRLWMAKKRAENNKKQ